MYDTDLKCKDDIKQKNINLGYNFPLRTINTLYKKK